TTTVTIVCIGGCLNAVGNGVGVLATQAGSGVGVLAHAPGPGPFGTSVSSLDVDAAPPSAEHDTKFVWLTIAPSTCGALGEGIIGPGGATLALALERAGAVGLPPIAPGTYPLGDQPIPNVTGTQHVLAVASAFDQSCGSTLNAPAIGGSISLTDTGPSR